MFKSRFNRFSEFGNPKYTNGQIIGDFVVIGYLGHSEINKRNGRVMDKPQHWYRCRCICGTEESRSQQELNDKRRHQACYKCRDKVAAHKNAVKEAAVYGETVPLIPNNEPKEQQYENNSWPA